jgi:hypothetical protein
VRELARDALVELAPVSVRGVEQDWRGQLADYVLGQQAGPEATATKGHLRRSEAARSWARSLLDSLEQFYENGSVPAIPDGERGRGARRQAAAAAAPAPDRAERTRPALNVADPIMRRRLLAGAGALALVLLLALFVWPGLLTGDDEDASSADSGEPAAQTAGGQGQQAADGRPAGIAIVVEQDGKKQLLVQAARLAPSGQSEGYYVWLYNSQGDSKSLGGQVTDQQGNYQAIGDLPADFRDYRSIDVTRQRIGNDADIKHSGDSVLRGPMPKLRKAQQQGNQPAALGQTVLQPPG